MSEADNSQRTTEGQRSSSEEWGDIFRRIEEQVRREAARAVGAEENADWATIGRRTDESARKNAAKAAGLGEAATWEEIAAQVERRTRGGIAKSMGLEADADWGRIGQTMETRMRDVLEDIFGQKKTGAPASEAEPEDLVDPWKADQ